MEPMQDILTKSNKKHPLITRKRPTVLEDDTTANPCGKQPQTTVGAEFLRVHIMRWLHSHELLIVRLEARPFYYGIFPPRVYTVAAAQLLA